MSGLAAMCRLAGGAIDPRCFQRVTSALDHRAIDGSGLWSAHDGLVALWHGQFWTTPEDEGERQPLCAGGISLVFDGRIDNRGDILEALGIARAEAASISDAALALEAYRRWGGAFLSRLQGPFAIIVWDAAAHRLLGARDIIGRRTLFYRLNGGDAILASEPGALLGGDVSGEELDEVFLAHLFALRPAPTGRTLFQDVRELPPGHSLIVENGILRIARHATLDQTPIRYRGIEDYGEHFSELLERAVRRRMRALGPPAVMMSGGLDSTSVAVFAGRAMAAETPRRRLSVLSYVFDVLTDLDERRWMVPMVARYDLDQTTVLADDAGPLSDFESWSWNASGPDTGPFRPLNERLYAAARAKGHRVLLTGAASDGLFVNGRASWLADLVDDGRWTEALAEFSRHLRRLGPLVVLRSESAHRLVARLRGRAPRAERPPAWLTPLAADCVAGNPPDGLPISAQRLPTDTFAALAAVNQSDGIATGDGEHRARIEVRDPFTDAALVSFMLSIPAYALYNQGTSKLILRQAMASTLPAQVLDRPTRSDITPLFWRGLQRDGGRLLETYLERSDAHWARYVSPDAIRSGRGTHAPALVRWHCLSVEWWLDHRVSTSVKAA